MTRFVVLFLSVITAALLLREFAPPEFLSHGGKKEQSAVHLGGIFSLSGFGAFAGQGELQGTLLAVEEINAGGGIGGRPLQFHVEDNQSSLRQTATAFRVLTSKHELAALLGPNWVEFAEVAAYLAQGAGVPMLTASGYKQNTVEENSLVFSTWPAHRKTTKPLARFITDSAPERLAAVVTENAYCLSVFAEMRAQLQQRGIELAEVMHFKPGTHDYRSAISRLKQQGMDAVLLFLLEDGETSSFLRQRRELRYHAQLYANYGIQFDGGVVAEPSLAEGVVYFDLIDNSSPEFRKKYKERFGEEPISTSSLAYDNVYVIKAAIERCGTLSEAITHCLLNETFLGTTGQIAFDQHGSVSGREHYARLMQVRNGAFVPMN